MITVVIYDSSLKHLTVDEQSRFERLFQPFKDRGEGKYSVRLCKWDRTGKRIDDAVPTLYQSIEGHTVWRAIVVTDRPHDENAAPIIVNPYDFEHPYPVDTDGNQIVPDLIRLSHMLCGYPPLGVLGYRTAYAYYDPEFSEHRYILDPSGKIVYQDEFNGMPDEEKEALLNAIDPNIEILEDDLELLTIEERYPPEVEEEHRAKTKLYSLRENRPEEVILLTLCEIPDYDYDEVIGRLRESKASNVPVDYCRKHNYPSGCRFLAYDIRNQKHTLYKRDLWKFWMLALTLAVNEVPSTSLQAHQLYKADVKINPHALGMVYERYLNKLTAIHAGLNEMKAPAMEEVTDAGIDLVPTQKVTVTFNYISDDRLAVGTSGIGFTSNCPKPEKDLWEERTQGCRKVIENALTKPREVVAFRAAEMRERIGYFMGKEHLLDRFEVDAIERRVDELEPHVMNAMVFGQLDVKAYRKETAQADSKVRKVLGTRLTRRNAVELGLIALFVYLCGFVPYLINTARIDIPTLGVSSALVGIALLIMALCSLTVLWFLRRGLIRRIKEYNKTNRSMMDRINAGADVFSDYFTNVCTYMYAKSLLTGVILKKDNTDRQEKLKKAHLRMIREERETADEICALYDVALNIPPATPYFIDFDTNRAHPHENRLYLLSANSEEETLELGNTGEMLYAPYSFIKGIELERVNINAINHPRGGCRS